MPVLGRLARLSISSITLPALLEKLKCELSDLLMNLCAVYSLGVAAYINHRLYCCFIGNNLNESKNRFGASGSRSFVLALTDN